MRLSALARKIDQTPKKLTLFLEENNIKLDNGINTILNEEAIQLVYNYFAPEQKKDPVIENTSDVEDQDDNLGEIDEKESQKESIDTKPEEDNTVPSGSINDGKEVDKSNVQVKPKAGTIEDLEEGKAEEIDLIKVKKVKLEGIKVVGKIELPEKPKKEESEKSDPNAKVETPVKPKKELRAKRAGHPGKKYQKGRKSRKPLSYEEKLKIEERNKKRQLKQKLKKEKERKKAHYEQTVKAKIVSKSKKKKTKKQSLQLAKSQEVVVYKNPIKRFWAWLNGKYDKY